MTAAFRASWALLLGVALMMLGSGLQNSLLGVRAEIEAFPTTAIGAIMSGFYAGFLSGSVIVPRIVQSVGHVRAFAALASLASSAALVHVVFVEPVTWAGMRMVTGFAYAGLYIIAESWLNDRATNESRGQLLAAYMVIGLGGQGLGQLLLNLDSPAGFQLFVLVSVLISLALMPILLSRAPAPAIEAPEKVSIGQLYRISPLGVVGCVGAGAAHGALLGMGAVFGRSAGLSVAEVSAFMGSVYLGAVVMQWPLGRLSDRFDRRQVLAAATLLAGACALGGLLAVEGPRLALMALAAAFGGLSFPLYALSVSHTNDYLTPRQMVAASASLYFVLGIGAMMGPLAVSWTMSAAGPAGFFAFLAGVHGAVGLFALWRMTRRAARPVEEQGQVAPVAAGGGALATVMAAETRAEHDATPAPGGEGTPESRPEPDLPPLPEPANTDLPPGGTARAAK